MPEGDAYVAPESGEMQGIYTISQIPIFNLSVLENAKTTFMLNLNKGGDEMEAANTLLNILCLQEETIEKQFGECKSVKDSDGVALPEYRDQLETAMMTGKNASKLLNTLTLRRIAHACNKIFDKYMVRLNDALPMQRINPEEKLGNRLFALVPDAEPKKMAAEHEVLREKRMTTLKEKKGKG